MRVVQYGVHDPGYPRNARLRAALVEQCGAHVVVVPRARGGGRIRRAVRDVAGLWRASRAADVLVLSEFRTTHAPLVWAVARFRGAVFVVDHFVGLHETVVEDHAAVPAHGLRARRSALQDLLAVRLADVCLTDTAARALRFGRLRGRPVIALPVGSPAWAVPAPLVASDVLRLLYVGNHLPLHGVDTVVDALVLLAEERAFTMTFVGGGADRDRIVARVHAAGLDGRCRFVDAVPEPALADHIAAADVVLGVFGTSRKSREVVPNKVWQGLACGRLVVTGDGPAVRELHEVVGDQLVLVPRADPAALARALAAASPRCFPESARRLSDVTTIAYRALGRALRP